MSQLPSKTGAGSVTDSNTTVAQQQTNFGNWLQFLIDLFGSADSATAKATVVDNALGISGSIVAAATTDLSTLPNARLVTVTNSGSVAISSFGTVQANAEREVTVSNTGTLTLTASANLQVPGVASGNSITLYNGDVLRLVSLGAGAWKVREICRYNWTTDPIFGFKNKIRNPRMDIAQRGAVFSNASGYKLDGWNYGSTGVQVATVSQQLDAMAGSEMQYSHRVQVATANTTPGAGDFAYIEQPIEGFLVRDLIGNPIALRFEVKSPKAGTHCVALRNSGSDRSYVLTYNVAAANTWQVVYLTIPTGLITAGTWNWTTGSGLRLAFVLMCGTTFQTTAGAWQTGNFIATSGQVNCMDTVGNIFAITGVQLEKNNYPTAFEHRDIATETLFNQRYFHISTPGAVNGAVQGSIGAVAVGAGTLMCSYRCPAQMRAAPTFTLWSNGTQNQIRNTTANTYAVVTVTGFGGSSPVLGFSSVSASGSPWTVGAGYDFDVQATAEL